MIDPMMRRFTLLEELESVNESALGFVERVTEAVGKVPMQSRQDVCIEITPWQHGVCLQIYHDRVETAEEARRREAWDEGRPARRMEARRHLVSARAHATLRELGEE